MENQGIFFFVILNLNTKIQGHLLGKELDILTNSNDPKTTLEDNEWEQVICFEFIDPQFKGISRKGHINFECFHDFTKNGK